MRAPIPLPRPNFTSLLGSGSGYVPRPLPSVPAPIPMPRYMRPGGYDPNHTGDPHKGGGLLGNAFGWNGNPIYDALKRPEVSDMLMNIGVGLMREPDFGSGLAYGMERHANNMPQLRQERREKEASDKAAMSRDAVARNLVKWNPEFQPIADQIAAGYMDPEQGWKTAFEYQNQQRQTQADQELRERNAPFLRNEEIRQMYLSGAFEDFKQAYDYEREAAKAPDPVSANIGGGRDWGDPGAGLEWLRDDSGEIAFDERNMPIAAPVQGTDQYQEMLAAEEARNNPAPDRDMQKANIVVDDIDRALGMIEQNPDITTGVGAWATGWLPGSPAQSVGELIKTVKANAGFDELQAMREASPTGGALGSITEREISYLQATIGSLEQTQDRQQLADNLVRVKNAYLDIIHGPGQGPPRALTSFEMAKLPKVASQTEYAQLPPGTQYVAPDGTVRTKP